MENGVFTIVSLILWLCVPGWVALFIEPFSSRQWRIYGIVNGALWAAYTTLIGIGTLIAQEGQAARYIDLETPPMRQLYIIYTCVSILAVVAVFVFYKFNLKVIPSENKAAKWIKKVLKVRLFTALVVVLSAGLLVVGLSNMLGIYDFSYAIDIKLLLIPAGIVLAVKIILYSAEKICTNKIVKAEKIYEDSCTFVFESESRAEVYAINKSEDKLFGRVYYLRMHTFDKKVTCNKYRYYNIVIPELELAERLNAISAERVSPQKARAKTNRELFPSENDVYTKEECW